jgi:hypothetical protein
LFKRQIVLVLVLVALVSAAPLWAASSRGSSSPDPRIAQLQGRVTSLEKRVKTLAVIDLRLNSEILNTQTRVFALETKDFAVTAEDRTGIPTVVQPQTWGSADGGTCGLGAVIGGGFHTDYPAEMGTSELSALGWSIHVFNPQPHPISLTADSVCLSVK